MTLTRRDALRAFGALPVLFAGGRALAAGADDFAAGLDREPRLLGFASVRAEALEAPLATLSGRLPPGLAGTLWRNGPAEHERFGQRYGHWFDGDGMAQAFTLDEGDATHRARILDTPKRRREARAGRRTMPAFGTVPPDPEPVRKPDDMNAANTSMLAHAGRLMALWEGGSALEVEGETLAAGGFVQWSKALAGVPFSAHPKVEADGTLWNIGCMPGARGTLLFYRIDAQGRVVKAAALPTEPLGVAHDFVVTARHLVLLLTAFVVEPERLASGHASFLDSHVWRPGLGTRVLVVDKETLAPARRHDLPAGFHFHHGNGWEEADGTIRLDLCQAPDPAFVTKDLRAVMEGDWRFASAPPRYRRVVLRPDGGAEIDAGEPGAAEFPRIDPRRTGLRHRSVFALTGAGGKHDWPLRSVSRIDADGGAGDAWPYPPQQIPEEHVFVPRGAEEGDGWLVGPFLDVRRGVTGLSVFEAARLAEGPLWQGLLPYPLPLALHGIFVPA